MSECVCVCVCVCVYVRSHVMCTCTQPDTISLVCLCRKIRKCGRRKFTSHKNIYNFFAPVSQLKWSYTHPPTETRAWRSQMSGCVGGHYKPLNLKEKRETKLLSINSLGGQRVKAIVLPLCLSPSLLSPEDLIFEPSNCRVNLIIILLQY